MKFDFKSILAILCYILAIYGLIVLIRKIMSDDKDKKWFSENYRYGECKCEMKCNTKEYGDRCINVCTGNCSTWDD